MTPLVKYWVSASRLSLDQYGASRTTLPNPTAVHLAADVEKMVEENTALQCDLSAQLDENKILQAELARKGELADHLEGGMASITDFLNAELRENYGGQFQVDQYTDSQAITAGLRHLVDCIKTHHEQRLARVKAENEQLHEELRSIL